MREADGVTELHVDDGHGCGKEAFVAELLASLSEKIVMKYVQGIWSGNYEYLKTMKVRDETKLTSIPNKKYLQSALNKLEMGDSKVSVSPTLDKACIDGDSEELDEGQTSRFRSSVLTLLYLSNERNGHSKHGTIVVYEVEKSDSVGDETIEEATEIRQGHRGHVNCT